MAVLQGARLRSHKCTRRLAAQSPGGHHVPRVTARPRRKACSPVSWGGCHWTKGAPAGPIAMATDPSCCSHDPGPREGTQGCLFSDGTGGDAPRPSWGQRRGHHHGPGERKGSALGSKATAAHHACGCRRWPIVAGVGAHYCRHASMTMLPFQTHPPVLATALPTSTLWNSVCGSDRGVSEAPLPLQRLESAVRWAPRLPTL